jgi:hypothetical protein
MDRGAMIDSIYYSDEDVEVVELRSRLQHYRSTSPSSMVGWIPFGLALLLAVVTWQSWHILYPGFARLQSFASSGFLQSVEAPVETEYLPSSAAAQTPDPIDQRLSHLFSPQVLHWRDQILSWADQNQLDPNLVAVVMQIESCGYPGARSTAGAMGLFQVMPYHFDGTVDPFDPDVNALTGLSYLSQSSELANGQLDRTLAGYNGGHGVIHLPSSQWSPETIRYVAWGTGIMTDIAAGLDSSPTLQAWLEAGGSILCSQASTASLSTSD